MRLNSRTRQACSKARKLMATGLFGTDLKREIVALCDDFQLNPSEREAMRKRLAAEYGILGQAVHDPNLYANCSTAKKAKQLHPQASTLLAVYETPQCETCSFRRASTCGLMGGKILANPNEISDKIAQRTADVLIQDGAIQSDDARKVMASQPSPRRRVAALHKARMVERVDETAQVAAIAASRQAAAILDVGNKPSRMRATPKNITGPGRSVNAESRDAVVDMRDGAGSRTARREGKVFAQTAGGMFLTSPMVVEMPIHMRDKTPYPTVASEQHMTIPGKEKTRTRVAADEEHAMQAQHGFNKLMRRASALMAQGGMTTDRAARFMARAEAFQGVGVTASETESRLLDQLSALTGGLEA